LWYFILDAKPRKIGTVGIVDEPFKELAELSSVCSIRIPAG